MAEKKIILTGDRPTGPLHFGHGRGGIIGDVMARVLAYLGHTVSREFYVNDGGNQMRNLAASLKIRCMQELGTAVEMPDEEGYHGEYLIELAKQCIKEHGNDVVNRDDEFFGTYAKDHMLTLIKQTLTDYRVEFDSWFSEKSLFDSGAVEKTLERLREKDLLYEKDGALWFKATEFGDDKDRVIKKRDGNYTYIAPDIAYHADKFDRGNEILIDVLGQDHHGYVTRLKAMLEALDYPADGLRVILYQLVSITSGGTAVKMSKRAGTFTELREVIDTVGVDVARFFYLNRKAEAHLDFDLEVALKKTEENPVYYIQYGYVRTKSLMKKAREHEAFAMFLDQLEAGNTEDVAQLSDPESPAEHEVIKKIVALDRVLDIIVRTRETQQLAYYTSELAHVFHHYYATNRIVDPAVETITKRRLFMTFLTQRALGTCLELLGLSQPESM